MYFFCSIQLKLFVNSKFRWCLGIEIIVLALKTDPSSKLFISIQNCLVFGRRICSENISHCTNLHVNCICYAKKLWTKLWQNPGMWNRFSPQSSFLGIVLFDCLRVFWWTLDYLAQAYWIIILFFADLGYTFYNDVLSEILWQSGM